MLFSYCSLAPGTLLLRVLVQPCLYFDYLQFPINHQEKVGCSSWPEPVIYRNIEWTSLNLTTVTSSFHEEWVWNDPPPKYEPGWDTSLSHYLILYPQARQYNFSVRIPSPLLPASSLKPPSSPSNRKSSSTFLKDIFSYSVMLKPDPEAGVE